MNFKSPVVAVESGTAIAAAIRADWQQTKKHSLYHAVSSGPSHTLGAAGRTVIVRMEPPHLGWISLVILARRKNPLL